MAMAAAAAALLLVAILAPSAAAAAEARFYDLSLFDIDGRPVSLRQLVGQVSLVINVASFCGLTQRNYEELVQLQKQYGPEGFTVLAFPCNQFNLQEPGSNAEIKAFAAANYSATFPMFAKVTVNDPMCPEGALTGFANCLSRSTECCPVNNRAYEFLKASLPGKIDWNFAKFLISKEGIPIQRYAPTVTPLTIAPDIQKALKKPLTFIQ